MNNYYLLDQASAASYGIAVYGPVIAMVVMIFLAVPIWVVLVIRNCSRLVERIEVFAAFFAVG